MTNITTISIKKVFKMTLARPKLIPFLSTESSQKPRKQGVETVGKVGDRGRVAWAAIEAYRNERVNRSMS